MELLFAVKDSGVGIAKEKQAQLFESFTQADVSTTREYGGTGLGLTISLRLVELMGGRLWVDSIVDQGTTFYFSIKLTHAPAITKKITQHLFYLANKRLLLVNDNQINLENKSEIEELIISLKNIYEDQWKKNNEINTSIKLPITISINSKKTKKIPTTVPTTPIIKASFDVSFLFLSICYVL